ncbi:MAG: alpha-hydroxy-acid oxidizing protein [Bryobacterales bacterium]|jgi:isopentenyl diphosphate isomerase/L-lactate dehydrogenase-like FMN-dependent dehydrogenase|nr:alpha-hydroxy-acid oxidizing protein [Bryobacterales bacterium]
MTRREAAAAFFGMVAGSPLLPREVRAQIDQPYQHGYIPPLEDLVNIFEFDPICRMRLPKQNYDYIATGVDNEWSLRRNREAFDKITFRPRMLVNASDLDLSLDLFGTKLSFPVLIAPTAGHGLAHPDGELATAGGAAALETVLILSTNSSHPYEKVVEATKFPKWFQLYPGPDLEGTWDRLDRVASLGFKVLVLTVDAGYSARRERLMRNRIRPAVPAPASTGARRRRTREEEPEVPSRPKFYGLGTTLMHQLDWNFFDELKKRWNGPVLVKGILTGEDGDLAARHGADGVIVSNHGARYLEYAPSTIEVLPEIVDAVQGRLPVLIDGGFRRGTDVLKALAIGATAVCVGRPPLWGLGAYGEPGVKRVLELLRTELALAMGLCGRRNLKSIDRSVLRMG